MNEKMLEEMVERQKSKLLYVAKRIHPHVVQDDILQPQDYPEIDFHPEFRYEEGVLHGLETALQAVRTEQQSAKCKVQNYSTFATEQNEV